MNCDPHCLGQADSLLMCVLHDIYGNLDQSTDRLGNVHKIGERGILSIRTKGRMPSADLSRSGVSVLLHGVDPGHDVKHLYV